MNGARKFLSLLRNSTEEPLLFPCPFPHVANAARDIEPRLFCTVPRKQAGLPPFYFFQEPVFNIET